MGAHKFASEGGDAFFRFSNLANTGPMPLASAPLMLYPSRLFAKRAPHPGIAVSLHASLDDPVSNREAVHIEPTGRFGMAFDTKRSLKLTLRTQRDFAPWVASEQPGSARRYPFSWRDRRSV